MILALRVGAYIETAAQHVGLTRETYYAWTREGARAARKLDPAAPRPVPVFVELPGEEPGSKVRHQAPRDLIEFSDMVNKSVAEAELRDLSFVDRAARSAWQAAAWKLERKHPERWAATHRVRLEVERQVDEVLAKLKDRLPAATFRAVVAALQAIAVAENDGDAGIAAAAGADPEGPGE